jgi:glucokinase
MSVEEPQPPFYLGIDLGGTQIKAGVVDDRGRKLHAIAPIPTEADRGPEVGLENIARAGRKAVDESGVGWDAIAGVGLGSPGTMDIRAGMLLDPPNLPGWIDLPIRQRIAERLGKPTVLQNDANAAAYGEYWVGAGRAVRSLVMFTLGTGIGCGVVDEGRIVEGRHSHGAECGHIIIQMDGGRTCSCGKTGHLEAYASATALVKRAVEAIEAEPTSALKAIHDRGELSSRAINDAALAGDAVAARLMDETARYLAVGAASLMHTIDPDLVLFGGGMIAAGPKFLDAIRGYIQKLAFPIPARETRVDYAGLGGDAGFIGAAGCARIAHRTTFAHPDR